MAGRVAQFGGLAEEPPAKIDTRTERAAAARPGARRPPRLIMAEPKAGPATAPMLVTTESQPRLLVRCFGFDTSATYACTTPMVPPPVPWISRDTSSATIDPAKAKRT
jgi:hypothetical protein